jgi:proteasome accessory factor C
VAEYYEVERVVQHPDGRMDVTLPAKDLAWMAKLILRLGGEAKVLEPTELARMVTDGARRTLALYRRDAPKGGSDGTGRPGPKRPDK